MAGASLKADRSVCDLLPGCYKERPFGYYKSALREYLSVNAIKCGKLSKGTHKDLLPGILIIKCTHGVTLGIILFDAT